MMKEEDIYHKTVFNIFCVCFTCEMVEFITNLYADNNKV